MVRTQYPAVSNVLHPYGFGQTSKIPESHASTSYLGCVADAVGLTVGAAVGLSVGAAVGLAV